MLRHIILLPLFSVLPQTENTFDIYEFTVTLAIIVSDTYYSLIYPKMLLKYVVKKILDLKQVQRRPEQTVWF